MADQLPDASANVVVQSEMVRLTEGPEPGDGKWARVRDRVCRGLKSQNGVFVALFAEGFAAIRTTAVASAAGRWRIRLRFFDASRQPLLSLPADDGWTVDIQRGESLTYRCSREVSCPPEIYPVAEFVALDCEAVV